MAAVAESASVYDWDDVLIGATSRFRKRSAPERDFRMSVILVFVLFVLIGDVAAIGISYEFERVSNFVSLLVFLGLFILVFGVAWKLAVYVTERYILRQS
jgi:hypothetical protein